MGANFKIKEKAFKCRIKKNTYFSLFKTEYYYRIDKALLYLLFIDPTSKIFRLKIQNDPKKLTLDTVRSIGLHKDFQRSWGTEN